MTGTQDGFQTEVRTGVVLTVGQEAIVDLSLPVGTVTQTVTVTGGAPLVETTTASIGFLVGRHNNTRAPVEWEKLGPTGIDNSRESSSHLRA